MEKKQDSLDYWLEEVQEKETYKFMYSKFLLTQIPLEVQEDEGMFAQVLNYGTKVLVSAVQHRHPETQCSRVIREAKRQVWKWKKELRDELPHATVEYYEENLAECALCVAWGILYLECRDEPRTAFLNQMLRIWKTQWSCYESVFGGEWPDKTKLDIMHDLVKEREEYTQHKKDTRKKETTQEENAQQGGLESLQRENERLKAEMAELRRKYEEEEFRKAVNEAEYLSSSQPSPLSLRIAKGKETSVLVTLDGMHKAGWIEGATRDEAIKEISLKLFGKEISTPAQRVSNARNTANPHIYKEAIEKAKEETENVLENLEDMEKYLLKK